MNGSAASARRPGHIEALRCEPVNQHGEYQQQDERRISCPVEHIARPKKIDLLDGQGIGRLYSPSTTSEKTENVNELKGIECASHSRHQALLRGARASDAKELLSVFGERAGFDPAIGHRIKHRS